MSGQALSDRLEAVDPQSVHSQAAQRGHGENATGLTVAVCVLPEQGVTGPVRRIFNRPAVSLVLQEGCGYGPEIRDAVVGLVDRLAVTCAFAAYSQDSGAAGPVLHDPLRCRHPQQDPGEVAAALPLAVADLKQRLEAVG